MKRRDRRRSRALASAGTVADLLHHLGDEERMGEHPYARSMRPRLPFEFPSDLRHDGDADALRAAALAAVARLRSAGERLHAIVARCDVGGELHKVVARDLGLSRRQFYRDLAVARERVAADLRAGNARHSAGSAPRRVAIEARLRTAISLSAGGHGKAAVDHFTPLVASLEGEEAIWGHCVLADLLLDDGRLQPARRELGVAVRLCENERSPGRSRTLLTRAKLLHQTGRATEACTALERVVSPIGAATDTSSPLAVDTLAEASALLAFCYHERGDFASAVAVHARNPASSETSRVSTVTRRQYLNVNAMLACDDRAGPESAQQACMAFYAFAISHGYLDDISAALVQMAAIARLERRLDDAQQLAQESLSIQRAIGSNCASVLGMLAGLAVDAGAYARALLAAREARADAVPGSHTWWGTHLHEAEALAGAGQSAQARTICERVTDGLSRDTRLAAWLRRVEATVFDALGDSERASRAAGESLEILGSDAPPFHRIKNLIVAQRIRPDKTRHAQIAHLSTVLGWDAAIPRT